MQLSFGRGEQLYCLQNNPWPQSTKSLVLGEKPELLFKMEQSPSSSKPGLPCEKPGRSTAQSCVFCFSPWNYFAHQGQPQKERDSTLCWRLWKLCHLSCASAQEQILLLSGGGNRYAPGYQEQPLIPAMPCSVLELCSEQSALFKPSWSTFWGSTSHHHQWDIMAIVQEQNPCADMDVSTHCPWRVYNLQLNLTSADQMGSILR